MVRVVNKNIGNGKAGARVGSPKGVVIHNDYGAMNPNAYIAWLERRKANNQLGLGYAHYYIDKDTILRIENTYNKAWHTGNNEGNAYYIGYEVVESYYGVISDAEFIENENMTLRQAAEDLNYYGLPVNRNTVRLHSEFRATSCPHRSWDIHIGKGKAYNTSNKNKLQDYFISKIKGYLSKGKTVASMLKNEGITGSVVVTVPKSTGTHTVVSGDSLWGIAIKFNTSISNIKALNGLKSDVINVGQTLKVNGSVSTPAVAKPKQEAVNVKADGKVSVDGYWGDETTLELQRLLGTVQDGKLSEPSQVIEKLQKVVGAKVDGYLGTDTIKALQRFLGTVVDGKMSAPSLMVKALQQQINTGKLTSKVVKQIVNKATTLKVDGYWGSATIKELQKHFGTPQDGIISAPSSVVKAIQKVLNVKVDGYLGSNTIKAMQKHFGTVQDGVISSPSSMVKVLQTNLNKGKF